MRKKVKKIIEFIVVFYVFSLVFLVFFQRNLMYFPYGSELQEPSLSGIEDYQIVTVRTELGHNVKGWYKAPQNGQSDVVIFFHGNGTINGPWYEKLRVFMRDGYGAFYAEYPGYAGNEGEPTEKNIYSSARAYIDWLTNEASVVGENIILYGESLGTGVAVQMATEYEVKAVILESPFTSTADVAKRKYFMYPVDFVMLDQYRSEDKINDVDEPLLIIHGDADDIVPYVFGQRLFDAADKDNKYFYTVQGHGHQNSFTVDAYAKMLEFLRGLENSDSINGQE